MLRVPVLHVQIRLSAGGLTVVTEPMTIFIVGQAVAIIAALVTVFVKINTKLTEIEIHLKHLETRRSEQRDNHEKLEKQVQGMSRTMERHATILKIGDG